MRHHLGMIASGILLLAPAPALLAQCDPVWLSGAPTAGIDNEVRKLLPWNDGLIATGSFTRVGAATAGGVAFWNNSTWSPVGTPISGPVLDAADFNGTLFIAGGFLGGSARNLARLEGGIWVPAGAEFNNWVNALTIHNGELYAAGYFTQATATQISRVAKWNGTAWEQVGSGLPATVYDLVSFNGKLIACGQFTSAGGSPTQGIAQWDGVTWSPIPGASFPNPPREMAVVGSELLVTGYSGGLGYFHTYDGATWHNKIETRWFALAGFAQYAGSIYIGGADTLITDTNGQWTRSPSLFTSPGYTTVFCMAEHKGALFIGGYFTTAGGSPAAMIARYYLPTADFNHDGDYATDADIEAFFTCLGGNCCTTCSTTDFDGDGIPSTDSDIEAFFRVLAGGCA